MTGLEGLTLAGGIVLAFMVWDACGWAAQAAFTWRMLHQWVVSEREGRSLLPTGFWAWSLVGSGLDLVYLFHRRDPVFVFSALVTTCIFARGAWMSRWPRPPSSRERPVVWPIVVGVLAFLAITAEALWPGQDLMRFDRGSVWLAIGFLGSVGWAGRFVVQWWASERRGIPHLPASFFRLGLVSAALLTVYAVSQTDWVKMFAFGTTMVPYARNLVLIRRSRRLPPDEPARPTPSAEGTRTAAR